MKPSDELAEAQQQAAIHHEGTPARLLAGPGTGKTWALTQRVIRLVKDSDVLPTNILALTFTRAAAQELRARVREAAGEDEVTPPVSTLHSFALTQIIRNSSKLDALPQPLRIADGWEQKNIIEQDIRKTLGLAKVDHARDLFSQLAADWETLRADEQAWEKSFPNPEFIGAWHDHRNLYGYTMLSELVYQLKRALEQVPDFEIEGPPHHLLVDEYQDLNRCDIAVLDHIRKLGAELYVAGDDDQSIYGFRNAHPVAIRAFTDEIDDAADLRLEVCRRCPPEVLRLADFVIRQEVGRIPKELRPRDGSPPGAVHLRQYRNQTQEAESIAAECARIVADGISPSDIIILLRSDRNRVFSEVIEEALLRRELPTHIDVGDGPFDSVDGRRFLALLRIAVDRDDSLAWRTLIQLDNNGLGPKARETVEDVARATGVRFATAVIGNIESDACGSVSQRLRTYSQGVIEDCEHISAALDVSDLAPDQRAKELPSRLSDLPAVDRIENVDDYRHALTELLRLADDIEAQDLRRVVAAVGASRRDDEPVIDPEAINILSMHRAKGLGAHTVFVVAAEDEYIPGRADTKAKEDDERRLLYVSISRAREQLFITYCGRRTGRQQRTGRNREVSKRTLTRFLRDSYLIPE